MTLAPAQRTIDPPTLIRWVAAAREAFDLDPDAVGELSDADAAVLDDAAEFLRFLQRKRDAVHRRLVRFAASLPTVAPATCGR